MAQQSKFFRVAVEGATTDGRTIDRSWLEQIAASYNTATYGARVWLEHIRGTVADSPFSALGDVIGVKTQEDDIGGQKKLALYAQIKPLPSLVAMNKAGQKIYSSIEVNPKMADSGQAYLMGLAVTDSPASLGTEMLQFAAQNPKANPLTARKQHADNLFSELVPVTLEFEEVADPAPSAFATTIQGIRDTVAKFTGKQKGQDADTGALVAAVGDMAKAMGDFAEQAAASNKTVEKLSSDITALQKDHKELQAKYEAIDTTDGNKHSKRPPAAGGDGKPVTDC